MNLDFPFYFGEILILFVNRDFYNTELVKNHNIFGVNVAYPFQKIIKNENFNFSFS